MINFIPAALLALAGMATAMGPDQLVKAKADLIGKDIKDGTRTIGEVEDLMLDLEHSRVAFVLVSLEELVGNGDTYYVLPWGVINPVTGGKEVVVTGLTVEDMKSAPNFSDKTAWPPLSSDPWPTRVYNVGKKSPYWSGTFPRVYRASEVIDWDVRNSKNEDLGDIEEFVVDARDGSIPYAVLEFGGFLGVGDKFFAVPPRSLRADNEKKEFVFDVDKERLKSAPGFDKKHWPDMASAEFKTAVTSFYGGDVARGSDAPRTTRVASVTSVPRFLKSKDLVGKDVRNPQNENLGKIEEVVLDVEEGRIAYAVLSFGGFHGMGDKLFAVPPDALKFSADGDKIVLDVDKEHLKSAPGFDKSAWPEVSDRKWLVTVYEFYEVDPYWVPSPPPAEK